MSIRRTQFVTGENYYHIYNRGVEKRNIFLDRRDYERFLYLLLACNDTRPLENSQFYYRGKASIVEFRKGKEALVDIVCFCLMPNHFHILLRQRLDNGISFFMQKIGTGYAMYFNTKYKRSGTLFQGKFKAIHVDREEYLTHLTRYIHLNPTELREPQWKEKGIKNWKDTYEFVKKYPWSSYADYLGGKKFNHILTIGLLSDLYRTSNEYEQFVKEWLKQDLDLLSGYLIET